MANVRLEERFEKAVNAFFEAEHEERYLAHISRDTDLQKDEKTFTEKADLWITALRQILLFVPGAFLLYYATISVIFFLPEFGVTLTGLFLLFSGAFLTYASAGTLKNTKNLIVPASIAGVAVMLAIAASFFPDPLQPDLYFWYSIYLFPVALIVSKLLQAWLQKPAR